MNLTGHIAALTLLKAILSQSAFADNHQAIEFHIPAQNLSSALLEFSENSGVKTFFKADVTRHLKSNSLSGKYTIQQALDKLLENTGVNYRFTETESVTLFSDRTELSTEMLLALAPGKKIEAGVVNNNDHIGPVEQEDLTVSGYDLSGYRVINVNSATRTDTRVMELPQSIQVINRKLFEDQQNITVSESLYNVSGVVPRSPLISPNFEPTLIRGFRGEQLIDGFYQNLNTGDQGSLVNIQQIDVLKGANATLYSGGGGSPVGGIINMISKLPEKEAFYELGMKGGLYDFYQPYVDLNQPIHDNILFRVTAEYTNSESHIDVIETERFNINPTITFTDNETTNFTVQGKFSRWEQQDYQGLPATGTVTGNFKIHPELYIGPKDIDDSESEYSGVWGTLNHQINDIWTVTAKARYAHSEHDTLSQGLLGSDGLGADQPFSPPSTWGLYNAELFQEQEELTFQTYATAKFDIGLSRNTLLLGADVSEMDEKSYMDFDTMSIGEVDLNNPAFASYNYPGTRQNTQFTKNTTYGGYAQLQSSLYNRLHFLAGVRLGNITTAFENTHPFFGFKAESDETRFLPNVGAVLDITEEFSLFANYSEGMRAQSGVNFVSTPAPELSYQTEAGVKFNVAEQLTGQVAIFQIDRENIAVTDFQDTQLRSTAKGKQRSHGIETNIAWQATDGLNFMGNYSFTEARFKDSLSGVPSGNDLPGVPKHSGRFWANYDFQHSLLKGLSIGSGVYAQSSVYLSNANLYKTDSYYSVDASVAYKTERYKLGISVKNLTDQDYFQRLNYYGSRVTPAQGSSVFFTGSVRL